MNEIIDASQNEISVYREPKLILEEAKKAAQALMTVVSQKKKPVIMNGEQYLEFEDWQTLAQFYGLSAKVLSTEFIDFGSVKGWKATAVCIRNSDGMVLSSADSMCLNDEDKWSTRTKYEYVDNKKVKVGDVAVPLFQLLSMAQTRAAAKVLRNKLAWVAVLAGYKPNVAEEMTGDEEPPKKNSTKPHVEPPQETTDEEPKKEKEASPSSGPLISEAQAKRFYAIATNAGISDSKEWLFFNYELESSKDIPRAKYDEICNAAMKYKK